MKKYAIKITKGDEYKILFIDENKNIVIQKGHEFRRTHPREEGLLSCIEADFDENGNMSGYGYRLHEVFL